MSIEELQRIADVFQIGKIYKLDQCTIDCCTLRTNQGIFHLRSFSFEEWQNLNDTKALEIERSNIVSTEEAGLLCTHKYDRYWYCYRE